MDDKEVQFLINRIKDLSNRAYHKDIVTHTPFLNLYEQSIFQSASNSLNVNYLLIGGYEYAERKLVCFFSSNEEEIMAEDYISLLRIENKNAKFASELNHRDYLGAIMNIGIDRHMIGDICIVGDKAYVYVLKSGLDIIINSLEQVSRNKVEVYEEKFHSMEAVNNVQEKVINIASNRLDSIISSVYNISRTKANIYIDADRVFINSKLAKSHSSNLRAKDIVSVRGLGRFIYKDVEKMSRKGRLIAKVDLYL